MLIDTINLTTDSLGTTKSMFVRPGQTNLDVTIQADTWSTAIVQMQWSLTNQDHEFFVTKEPSANFSTSKTGRIGLPVVPGTYVRLKTTTGATGASEAARVIMNAR